MTCAIGDPCSIIPLSLALLIIYGPAIGHALFWPIVFFLAWTLIRRIGNPPPPPTPPPPPPPPNPKGTFWTRYEVNQFLRDLRDHNKR